MSDARRVTKPTDDSLLRDAGIETGEVLVGKQRLRYALRPGHGAPLLFCNGIGANLELVVPLLRKLAERPVVIVDLPGTGGSPSGWFWPSLPRYARMVVGALDQLGFDGPFAVAGVSWGGGLAQQIARDYKKRVSHLILMATSPGITMMPGKPSALLRMMTPQRYFSRGYMARHAATLYGGEMRNRRDHALQHAYSTTAPSGRAYIQQVMAMYQFSSLPWLRCIRCPALVISGDDDPLVRPVNARILAAVLRDAQLHIVPGGGHLFITLRPNETAALIDTFIGAEPR
ncbi:alpha/beta fold hydrolase [Algiphilus aromaticivorans]|uniref:alpha/beta fold hydrolase n=1 Tax=Algiphilus aromaticivorans TaxID=382454 RepID=UPI0009FDDE70|nr:alpha/beta hydrolase [Algiphilus aromaticivorans]